MKKLPLVRTAALACLLGGGLLTAEFAQRTASAQATAPAAGTAEDERQFAERDITEDGFLSGKEVKGFEAFDADGDRQVTKAEFLAGRAAARKTGPVVKTNRDAAKRLAEAFFQVLDENEDNRLSGTEIDPEMKSYDTDANGRITREEFVAGETSNPQADQGATATTLLVHALQTGDVKPFMMVLHPELRLKVEEPVLRWVVAAVRNEYGDVEGMENLATIDLVDGGTSTKETTVTALFKKGADRGEIRVETAAGEVLAFDIGVPLAKRINEVLYGRIAGDKAFGREVGETLSGRGKDLLWLIAAGKDEAAYGRFHPAFQKEFAIDAVKQLFAGFREAAGKVRSIEWNGLTSQFGADGKPLPKFSLDYELVGEKAKYESDVSFEFDGLSITIVGVDFKRITSPNVVDSPEVTSPVPATPPIAEDRLPQGWKRFRAMDFDFAMPAEAKRTESPNSAKFDYASDQQTHYQVTIAEGGEALASQADEYLKLMRTSFAEGVGGTIDVDKPSLLEGYPGMELTVKSAGEWNSYLRAYVVDTRVIRLVVMVGPESAVTPAERNAFLSSVRIPSGAKQTVPRRPPIAPPIAAPGPSKPREVPAPAVPAAPAAPAEPSAVPAPPVP